MENRLRRWRLWILVGCCVLVSACDLTAPSPSPLDASDTPQEIATETPPPLVIAPFTPPACQNAPPTRMIIYERGRVLDDDPRPINIRAGPGLTFRILGRIEVNRLFFVLDGPECADNYAWYNIKFGDTEGWLAEGDQNGYYVEPYLPG